MKKLVIAGREFNSRLFLGTGKFNNNALMAEAIKASETEMVTVAMKRVELDDKNDDLLTHITQNPNIQLLPNTSGVRNAEEAVFAAQMSREAFGTNWLKLEIHPDPRYLLPDSVETLKATEQLVKMGFVVLPYCQADPTLCKHLEEAGAATVMPLAAPIGTNKGLRMKDFLQIIIEQATVPVVVDAGIGAPSHAAEAMEMGADCCLVNTAIAVAGNPVDFNTGIVKSEIEVPDIKLNNGKIEVFSMLKRTPLGKHAAGDGNPLVYALKHDTSGKYKYFFKDPSDEEHVFEMIRESVKQFTSKYFSKIGTSSTTAIVVPSGNSLNSKFAKLASEVIKSAGYSVLINDSVLAKLTVEDFEDDVLNNPDSDFMFWIYSLEPDVRDYYSELLNGYLKMMKTKHNGLFSYHYVKDPEIRNKICISMKVIDKSFENINDCNVLLVDDTISRGATLIEACKNLCNSYSPKSITALTMFSKLEK